MEKLWHSIGWKILSCGCFAAINVLVRFLSGGSPIPIKPLPIYTIMFFQHALGALIISFWMWRKQSFNMQDFASANPMIHFMRILTAALGVGLFYLSLRYLPITQAVALSITTPIFTTLGAVLFLRERFDLPRKLAVTFSIFGGFLVAKPIHAFDVGFSWYMLLPILAALAFSFDKLLTRKLLVNTEKPDVLAWYLLVFIAPLSLLPSIYYGWVTPNLTHLPWLFALGIFGSLAHYTFNKAYAISNITTLLPFGAARLIIGAIFSYYVFAEIPKAFEMWIGIATILFSIIILGIKKETLAKIFFLQASKQGT